MKRFAEPENRKRKIITALLRWYRQHGRELPWRNEKDPYRILVSEVMLQQTQVARVMAKYPEFLRKFPTFRKLAHARTSAVIRSWRGMGYNNRALRLQALSRIVVADVGGKLPQNVEDLLQLPGIGRYTAHAIACFAFGQRVPVVDTNIARVFGRLHPVHKGKSLRPTAEVWTLASQHLPRSNAHDWNQALMDLGATICTAARPRCEICPLKLLCPSAHSKPRKVSRRSRREPGRNGIPNRIYRGKAIEILRDLRPGESMNSSSLARKVLGGYSGEDRRWFLALLRSLERDGLVRMRGRARISLPE
jgi:A/G-specific adenine glycosylase